MKDIRVGLMCDIKPEAWASFLNGSSLDAKWVRPQPIVSIDPVNGYVLLAFPYWWWAPEELLPENEARMTWSKEEEDACIDKHVRNLQTCARNHGEPLGPRTARSIAFGMMLSEQHIRNTEKQLIAFIQSRPQPPILLQVTPEQKDKLVAELSVTTEDLAAQKYRGLQVAVREQEDERAKAAFLSILSCCPGAHTYGKECLAKPEDTPCDHPSLCTVHGNLHTRSPRRCGKLCTDPDDECFSESSELPQYPCRLPRSHEGECLPKGNKR